MTGFFGLSGLDYSLDFSFDFDFGFDSPPHKVCRALPAEGQFSMDGKLSFVEHDCMDAGGTNPWMGEGRITQEQLSRTTQETKSRDTINLFGTNLNSSAGPKGEIQGCIS